MTNRIPLSTEMELDHTEQGYGILTLSPHHSILEGVFMSSSMGAMLDTDKYNSITRLPVLTASALRCGLYGRD
jgi:hypothetical protein